MGKHTMTTTMPEKKPEIRKSKAILQPTYTLQNFRVCAAVAAGRVMPRFNWPDGSAGFYLSGKASLRHAADTLKA